MSDRQGARAISAVSRGDVAEITGRAFVVKSGENYYMVGIGVLGPGQTLCTCKAGQSGQRCWHLRAVRLMMGRARLERDTS